MMKNENVAIIMATIVEQIQTIYNDEEKTNQQLYTMGVDIGHRIADQFVSRSCSFLSPAESTKKMLIAIAEQYMGIQLSLTKESIRFEKKFHYYDLQYTFGQAGHAKSMIGFCEDACQVFPKLVPEKLSAGILEGALETMNLFGTVEVSKNSGETVFKVVVKKEIKQED